MNSVQEYALNGLNKIAEDAGHTLMQDMHWQNTGHLILVMEEESVSASYKFNDGYCTVDYPTGKHGYYKYPEDVVKLRKDLECFAKKGKPFYTN